MKKIKNTETSVKNRNRTRNGLIRSFFQPCTSRFTRFTAVSCSTCWPAGTCSTPAKTPRALSLSKVKNTLETSGEDVKLHSKRVEKMSGLREQLVSSVPELIAVLYDGLAGRTTGVTAANVDSSRSHAVLQIALREGRQIQQDMRAGLIFPTRLECSFPSSPLVSSVVLGRPQPKELPPLYSKFSFIDLAGSERGADHMDNVDKNHTRFECSFRTSRHAWTALRLTSPYWPLRSVSGPWTSRTTTNPSGAAS